MFGKLRSALLGVGTMVFAIGLNAGDANASTITHGRLSSDSSTGLIVDTVSGTQYTRLDTFDWTVAQVQASVQVGGAFAGWSIMDATQADVFAHSLLGVSSSACSSNGSTRTTCGFLTGWSDADFGNSHKAAATTVSGDLFDYIAYIDDHSASDVGYLTIRDSDGRVRQASNRVSFDKLDMFTASNSGRAINLMLYQPASQADLSAVPLPASGLMLAGAFAGFGLMRRRRKAA